MGVPPNPPPFATVRFREGYSIPEVDEFLEQARAALEFDPPLMRSEEVEAKRFAAVRVRNGYEMDDVDGYLDRLADELRRLEPPLELDDDSPGASGVGAEAAPGSAGWRPDRTLWWAVAVVVVLLVLLVAALALLG